MLVIQSKKEIIAYRKAHRHQTIGLVATMGGLHQGHLDLVTQIQTKVDLVVATIFVNPSQFSPGEDFENYPRSLNQDLKKLEALKVDCVFAPDRAEIYQNHEPNIHFNFGYLSNILCGKSRPNFLSGVALMVSKLFNIIQPDVAIFGQKDYQQFKIIELINSELEFNIKLMMAPISRNADGLALSSRNNYLSASDQKKAAHLQQTLLEVEKEIISKKNDTRGVKIIETIEVIEEGAKQRLESFGLKPDYFSILAYPNLNEIKDANQCKNIIILAACYLHKTRLIDNKIIALQ